MPRDTDIGLFRVSSHGRGYDAYSFRLPDDEGESYSAIFVEMEAATVPVEGIEEIVQTIARVMKRAGYQRAPEPAPPRLGVITGNPTAGDPFTLDPVGTPRASAKRRGRCGPLRLG